MSMLSRFIREPLFHFVLIGAGLFVIYGVVKPTQPNSDTTLIVSAARQDSISAQFEATRRRPPNADEMANLIQNYLREEVLYRQAVALGLDKDDAVVRGRMRQKMEFFAESGARLLTPTDADLQTVLDQNPDKFVEQSRVAFRQVFLGERPTDGEIDTALARLQTIGLAEQFVNVGQRTLLPKQMQLSDLQNIESVFGPQFATSIGSANPGGWAGPIPSAYGQHLVLVTEKSESRRPEVDEIRDILTREWRFAKSNELKDRQFQDQLAKYEVIVETGDAQ